MVEPNVKYQFTEPFRSKFERIMQNYEATIEAKKNGTYQAPKPTGLSDYAMRSMAKQPPSAAQLGKLKKLGWIRRKDPMPMNKLEAHVMIDELISKGATRQRQV